MSTKKITAKTTMLSLNKGMYITNGIFFQKDQDGNRADLFINFQKNAMTNPSRPKAGKEPVSDPVLQTAEYVELDSNSKILGIKFGLKITSILTAALINGPELEEGSFFSEMKTILKNLKGSGSNAEEGLHLLSYALAYNIATGVFGHRNAEISVDTTVMVSCRVNTKDNESIDDLKFVKGNYSHKDPLVVSGEKRNILDIEDNVKNLSKLSDMIFNTLTSDSILSLGIEGLFDMGTTMAQVYPSQLFANKKDEDGYDLSRVLFQINGNPAMSSDKIGNAIRRVDIANSESENTAVEPFSIQLRKGVITRPEFNVKFDKFSEKSEDQAKYSFYVFIDILAEAKDVSEIVEKITPSSWLFIWGNLLRGGVFGKNG